MPRAGAVRKVLVHERKAEAKGINATSATPLFLTLREKDELRRRRGRRRRRRRRRLRLRRRRRRHRARDSDIVAAREHLLIYRILGLAD